MAPTTTKLLYISISTSLLIFFLLNVSIMFASAQLVEGQSEHTCVVIRNGRFALKCWGNNNRAQLGPSRRAASIGDKPNSMGNRLKPVNVGGPTWRACVAQLHTCVLRRNDKQVVCFGHTEVGALGRGKKDGKNINIGDRAVEMGKNLIPVRLGKGLFATQLACGAYHSCAILNNAKVKCWGGVGHGAVGPFPKGKFFIGLLKQDMGENLDYLDLGTDFAVTKMTTSLAGSCVLSTLGEVKCFGENTGGNLFSEETVNRLRPMGDDLPVINAGLGVTTGNLDVATSYTHTCILRGDGRIVCAGQNKYGQLGTGRPESQGTSSSNSGNNLIPVNLGENGIAIKVVVGDDFSCALLARGAVKCWGDNQYGQLGWDIGRPEVAIGDELDEVGDFLPDVDLGSDGPILELVAYRSHACATRADSSIVCWGKSTHGQLGTESTAPQVMGKAMIPVKIGANFKVPPPTLSTAAPTKQPTRAPTRRPTTARPTKRPTRAPTKKPTKVKSK